mmetsp:Transcript_13096/g.32076  ORF Transcript_13096/g.32076 Transcript_13096/m.32076 type:complete len:441 (-) Transcript_13096:242-1564(-)
MMMTAQPSQAPTAADYKKMAEEMHRTIEAMRDKFEQLEAFHEEEVTLMEEEIAAQQERRQELEEQLQEHKDYLGVNVTRSRHCSISNLSSQRMVASLKEQEANFKNKIRELENAIVQAEGNVRIEKQRNRNVQSKIKLARLKKCAITDRMNCVARELDLELRQLENELNARKEAQRRMTEVFKARDSDTDSAEMRDRSNSSAQSPPTSPSLSRPGVRTKSDNARKAFGHHRGRRSREFRAPLVRAKSQVREKRRRPLPTARKAFSPPGTVTYMRSPSNPISMFKPTKLAIKLESIIDNSPRQSQNNASHIETSGSSLKSEDDMKIGNESVVESVIERVSMSESMPNLDMGSSSGDAIEDSHRIKGFGTKALLTYEKQKTSMSFFGLCSGHNRRVPIKGPSAPMQSTPNLHSKSNKAHAIQISSEVKRYDDGGYQTNCSVM